jgi:large subunit ribosomal protein L27
MAHKKAGGSTALGRDSVSKRLGVKVFGDQRIGKGEIIVRQKGSKYFAGNNVNMGGDSTLYSLVDGIVKFQNKMIRKFHGNLRKTRVVSVVAMDSSTAKPTAKIVTKESKADEVVNTESVAEVTA